MSRNIDRLSFMGHGQMVRHSGCGAVVATVIVVHACDCAAPRINVCVAPDRVKSLLNLTNLNKWFYPLKHGATHPRLVGEKKTKMKDEGEMMNESSNRFPLLIWTFNF